MGLEVLKSRLFKYTSEIHERFNRIFILESIKFNLESDTFQFNNDFLNKLEELRLEQQSPPPTSRRSLDIQKDYGKKYLNSYCYLLFQPLITNI